MTHTSDGISIDILAIAILRHGDKIILVQQSLRQGQFPTWVTPGGLVEPGELILDGLSREVKEETGLDLEAVSHLACLMQIDRPAHRAQTTALVFEVAKWSGELTCSDPDQDVLAVETVSLPEAIRRLKCNGGWPCIQTPVIAYLEGIRPSGTVWMYREDEVGEQQLTLCVSKEESIGSFDHLAG